MCPGKIAFNKSASSTGDYRQESFFTRAKLSLGFSFVDIGKCNMTTISYPFRKGLKQGCKWAAFKQNSPQSHTVFGLA